MKSLYLYIISLRTVESACGHRVAFKVLKRGNHTIRNLNTLFHPPLKHSYSRCAAEYQGAGEGDCFPFLWLFLRLQYSFLRLQYEEKQDEEPPLRWWRRRRWRYGGRWWKEKKSFSRLAMMEFIIIGAAEKLCEDTDRHS